MISIPSALTGAAIAGLTSPVYNNVVDVATDLNSKQAAVTSLGGTQTGVTVHSTSSPFTLTFSRPKVAKVPKLVGTTYQIPVNVYFCRVRKGVTAVTGQPPKVAMMEMKINIPAGAETLDKANIDAMFSAAIGLLTDQRQGFRDTVGNNII